MAEFDVKGLNIERRELRFAARSIQIRYLSTSHIRPSQEPFALSPQPYHRGLFVRESNTYFGIFLILGW